MCFGWPSFWYIVVMVGLYIISTICSACNIYTMYSTNQNDKTEIEKKRLLAIEEIRAGAANSAELYDFVICNSDYYRDYLCFYSEEIA